MNYVTLTLDITTAAATNETRYLVVPWAGEWRLEKALFAPATTVAADAADYITVSLKNGSDTCGSLATSATASTVGTMRSVTLTAGVLDFTGAADDLEIAAVNTGGSGAAHDGSWTFGFRKLSKGS